MDINPESTLWIDAQAKAARNFGIQGTGRNGREIRARAMRENCSAKCRSHCSEKISLKERQAAFTNFWQLGDHTKQWECVSNWINTVTKKRDVSISDETDACSEHGTKRKHFGHTYSLPGQNGPVKVCQLMFLNTLDISYSWVRTADLKVNMIKGSFGIDVDSRGKHRSRPNRIAEELKKPVREHIASFPTVEEDHESGTTTKKYLSNKLNMYKMYTFYRDQMTKRGESTFVSYQIYRQIFKEFNYGFISSNKKRRLDPKSGEMDDITSRHHKKFTKRNPRQTHIILDNKTGYVAKPEIVYIKSEDSLSIFEDVENSVSSPLDEYWTASPTHFLQTSAEEQTAESTDPTDPADSESDRMSTSYSETISNVAGSTTSTMAATIRCQNVKCIQVQKTQFDFEKEKFNKNIEMQNRLLKLEEEKFCFEKEFRSRELEFKKLEIEKDESLKKLEIEKNERVAKYLIEMKYKIKKSN